MAGACSRLPLLLLLVLLRPACRGVFVDPQAEEARLRRELGRVDSTARLLGLLAPTDARLCDEELLRQLEEHAGDDASAQEGLENLRSVCNATKTEFTRGFPMIGGRALKPANTVSPRVLRVMARLFKRAIPRSRCKPRAAVVALQPADTRYYYLPSCVSVKRCSGCCDLEEMSCTPDATRAAKKQVIVIDMVSSLGASLKTVKTVLVEEHVKCKCA